MENLATWKIHPDQYGEWKCLHKEYPRDQSYGCEFNTLVYLNSLPRDIGEYLTRQTNELPVKEAATQERVVELLRDYYPNHYEDTIPRWSFVDRPFGSKAWEEVLKNMKNDEATFLWLIRKEPNPNHAVVLYRKDDQLSIVDAQQEKVRKFWGFEQWFKRMGVTEMRFLVAAESKKRAFPRYGPFRKRVSPPRKRQRIGSKSRSKEPTNQTKSNTKSNTKSRSKSRSKTEEPLNQTESKTEEPLNITKSKTKTRSTRKRKQI